MSTLYPLYVRSISTPCPLYIRFVPALRPQPGELMFDDDAFRDWSRYNPPHGNARAGAPLLPLTTTPP